MLVKQQVPGVSVPLFIRHCFSPAFERMELKDRMRHTAKILGSFLDPHYPTACQQLIGIIEGFEQSTNPNETIQVAHLFFPEFITTYGLTDVKTSIQTMERLTQFISCEFAVRPFLISEEKKMLAQMLKWSKHPHAGVRRLASEGSRPRLPWGMKVPALIHDPNLILPILENLREDTNESVRRSVANSLNDISKDHPEVVLDLAQKWANTSAETDAILKHGLRTLLKKGHPQALKQYNLNAKLVTCKSFCLLTSQIKTGDRVKFEFTIENTSSKIQTVRIEYKIYFLRHNGTHSGRVFKISERQLQPGEILSSLRHHSFRPITTMRYYPGKHAVALVVNGKEYDREVFDLIH
jgi:3-methyladenine DNA glycosylase AlkC